MPGPTGTPPPLLPGIMRLAVDFESPPCVGTNVLHFQCHETGGLGSSDVLNMATALGGYWINDLWKTYASHDATSLEINSTYALIEGQPNVKRVRIVDAVAGLATSDTEWGQVSGLINWDSGDPRRGGKPRNYLPFFKGDGNSDSGNWASAIVTAMNTACGTFLGHVQGHTAGSLVCDNFVDYSTVLHGAYRLNGAVFPIPSGSFNPHAGTQRRRVGRLFG